MKSKSQLWRIHQLWRTTASDPPAAIERAWRASAKPRWCESVPTEETIGVGARPVNRCRLQPKANHTQPCCGRSNGDSFDLTERDHVGCLVAKPGGLHAPVSGDGPGLLKRSAALEEGGGAKHRGRTAEFDHLTVGDCGGWPTGRRLPGSSTW